MELQEGYKLTEVGVIPEDWDVSTIGSEFQIQLGKMLDSEKNTGILKPYLGNKAVQWSRIDIDNLPVMAMSRSDLERYRLHKGDLLVCEGGEIGRAAIWEASLEECYYQKALHRLRPLVSFETPLLLAFLRYWADRKMLTNFVTQTSIAHLTREKLAQVPLPKPKPEEQRAIIEVLRDFDYLAVSLDKLITKKQNIKQGMMQQLLSGNRRLEGFADDWEATTLGDCLLKTPDYGINAPAVPYTENLPTYLRITDISEDGRFLPQNKTSVRHASSYKYFLEEDDIVFARTGASTGKAYSYDPKDGDLVFAGFLIRAKVNPNKLAAQYLKSYTETKAYWNWVKVMSMRSGQPGINGSEYAQLPINLPPLPEQRAIAQILSDMNTEVKQLEEQRDKYKAIKQGMMQELLTGKTRLI